MDYTDLHGATDRYRKKALELDAILNKERDAKLKLWEEQVRVRKEYFPQLASKQIAHALFREYLKNETFEQEVEVEKLSTQRKIIENQLDALKEILYTTKRVQDAH